MGKSHLHSEVDDPLDSHERAQLRHLPAAGTGQVGLRLIQTSAHSAPYLSLRLRFSTPTNQQPHNSEKANGKRNSGREVGSRAGGWVEGAFHRSRGKGIPRNEVCRGLVYPNSLPATPAVPRSATHISVPPSPALQVPVSVFPRAPCAFFPRPQGLLHLIASTFFLQIASLSLRPHSPLIYFPVSARPHLLPCDYILYDSPESHNLSPCPRSLRIP